MLKKILFFIIVLLIAIMPVLSFAYNLPIVGVNGIEPYGHYVIIRYNDFSYGAVLIRSDITDISTSADLCYSATKGLMIGSRGHIFATSTNGVSWVKHSYSNNYAIPGFGNYEIIDSSFDVKYGNGTVFFSKPVRHLVEGMMEADSGMILRTISHGLILVSGCLISAICFRKAWGFLHNQLQH